MSWTEFVSNHLTELEIRAKKGAGFKASIDVKELGYLRLANPHSSSSYVEHSKSCLSRYDGDAYLLHMQAEGRSINRQSGYEAVLNTGDFTLCDTTRPYNLEFDDTTKICWQLFPVRP